MTRECPLITTNALKLTTVHSTDVLPLKLDARATKNLKTSTSQGDEVERHRFLTGTTFWKTSPSWECYLKTRPFALIYYAAPRYYMSVFRWKRPACVRLSAWQMFATRNEGLKASLCSSWRKRLSRAPKHSHSDFIKRARDVAVHVIM